MSLSVLALARAELAISRNCHDERFNIKKQQVIAGEQYGANCLASDASSDHRGTSGSKT